MMLKKVLKGAGAVVAVAAGGMLALAAYVQVDGIPRYAAPPADTRTAAVTPEAAVQGKKLVTTLCAGCHENQETHRLTGRHLSDVPAEFGEIYSKNITRHPTKGIGGWTDGELRTLLRTGLRPDGQYVPPYMVKLPHTSDEEVDAVIAFLRSDDPLVAASDVDPPGVTKPSFLVKALSHVAFEPLPLPTKPVIKPPKSDAVALGRYLVASLDCYSCHSASFTSMNVLEPEKSAGYMGGGNELKSEGGKAIVSANLTADVETGIGGWTEADFVRAVKKGFRPDGRVLAPPMEPRPELDDDEVAAMYTYLRTVPKIRNTFPRPTKPPAVADHTGKAIYDRYGCSTCHGDSGKGAVGDLRRANADYPTDAELRKWIDEAPTMKPGTRMPGWKGVVEEDDYAPLLAYVRVLSAAGDAHAAR